jgi:glycosyltransferase involved in cell wall biosynthesis
MKKQLHTDIVRAENSSTYSYAGRVCMHVLGPASTDVRVMRAAIALTDAGYAVSVVDIVDKHSQSIEDIRGVSIKHMKVSSAFIITRFRRWAVIKALLLFIRSTLLLLHTPADFYHAHDFAALPACFMAARLRGKPLIFEAHELPLSELDVPYRRWLRFLLTPLLAHMIASCAGGIGASPYYEQVLRERYHISRVSLLRNMPPYRLLKKNDRLHQQLGLDPSVRIALYQGNIQPHRGLDTLVRAAAFLEDDIVIIMMGKGVEPTISQLKALIASEEVDDRVKILPPVPYEELLDWTASADLGLNIIPLDETLNKRTCIPNKFFEYIMAGLPVLTSPLDAVEALVTSYNVGLVVSSLAPADVGAAINAMLADPVVLASMRRNALEVARNEFNWEKESLRLVHLYQGIRADGVRRKSSEKYSTASE